MSTPKFQWGRGSQSPSKCMYADTDIIYALSSFGDPTTSVPASIVTSSDYFPGGSFPAFPVGTILYPGHSDVTDALRNTPPKFTSGDKLPYPLAPFSMGSVDDSPGTAASVFSSSYCFLWCGVVLFSHGVRLFVTRGPSSLYLRENASHHYYRLLPIVSGGLGKLAIRGGPRFFGSF